MKKTDILTKKEIDEAWRLLRSKGINENESFDFAIARAIADRKRKPGDVVTCCYYSSIFGTLEFRVEVDAVLIKRARLAVKKYA